MLATIDHLHQSLFRNICLYVWNNIYQTRCSRGCSTNTFVTELLIHSLSHSSFVEISSEHLHSQTVRARELKFWEKVHLPPPELCHVKHATCHMSCVILFFLNLFVGQSGEARRWRVCYQRGLPRLVFVKLEIKTKLNFVKFKPNISAEPLCQNSLHFPFKLWPAQHLFGKMHKVKKFGQTRRIWVHELFNLAFCNHRAKTFCANKKKNYTII